MWIEQLQNGLNVFIVFIAGTVFTVFAKIYLEKIIIMRKLLDFLGHFIPAVAFLAASSSKEVCSIAGSFLGETEITGFYVLAMMGFIFATSTVIFLCEISRDNVVSQNQSKDSSSKQST